MHYEHRVVSSIESLDTSNSVPNPTKVQTVICMDVMLYDYSDADVISIDSVNSRESCPLQPLDIDVLSVSGSESSKSGVSPAPEPLDPRTRKCDVVVGFFANINTDRQTVQPWIPCNVIEVSTTSELFAIKYVDRLGQAMERKVDKFHLAEARPLHRNELIDHGVRIIAQRDPLKMPYRYKSSLDRNIFLFSNSDDGFYSGFTGDQHTINGLLHTMVFFDDGHVQYVPMKKIRTILDNDMCTFANDNVNKFYHYYMDLLSDPLNLSVFKIPTPAEEDFLRIDSDCFWEEVQVIAIEGEMVQVFFMDTNRYEWLWFGSPRMKKVWKAIVRDKHLNKKLPKSKFTAAIDLDTSDDDIEMAGKAILKTTADVEKYIASFSDPGLASPTHRCSNSCVSYEKNVYLAKHQALLRPMLTGWKRKVHKKVVYYRTPCGIVHHRLPSIRKFLRDTKSELAYDCFSFNLKVDCMKEYQTRESVLKEDISNGLEMLPVRLVGHDINAYPKDFQYIEGYSIDSFAVPSYFWHPYRKVCCDCDGICSDRSKCACQRLTRETYEAAYSSGVRNEAIGYEFGTLGRNVTTGIFECHSDCQCSKVCANRVIQKPLRYKFEVFQTQNCGWGVRTRQDLPSGVYVSHYIGDLLPDDYLAERADISGDSYFFILDSQYAKEEKDQPPAKKPRLSTPKKPQDPLKTQLPYFPVTTKSENPKDKTPYTIDARYRSNFTRFINHSCEPNLQVQLAFIDTHDRRFPWAAFFTTRVIKAGEEITFHYGYKDLDRGVSCQCGAKTCSRKLL